MDISVETITPALAQKLLEGNRLNRPLNRGHARFLSKQMVDNAWILNGESIKIDTEGRLIDGQHRLTACMSSKRPFQTVVVRNADSSIFDTIDTGKRRAASDVLALSGECNTSALAGGLRLISALLNYPPQFSLSITNHEVMELLKQNAGIRKWARKCFELSHLMPPAISCGLFYKFSQSNETKAGEFFIRLKDGVDLWPNHPVLLLRDRLIKEKAKRAHLHKPVLIAITIKAWNDFVSGRNSKVLRWRSDEEFPVIV